MPGFLRFATLLPVLVLFTAACGGIGFSTRVGDVVIPGNTTAGTICYVKGERSSPRRFSSATYSADATYTSDTVLIGSDSITVRVYGRTTRPDTACTPRGGADVELSEPITLIRNEERRIVVGGSGHGAQLAEVVASPDYWIGVSIEGDYTLSTGERIRLENGRISVTL